MCLALPVEIKSVDEARETAIVGLNGIRKEISTALLDDVSVGDFVLLHVGFALHKISEDEAERTLSAMAESGLMEETLQEHLS